MSKLGIYVHIPYCIQRCKYCDFATYEQSQILKPEKYFQILKKEIQVYAPTVSSRVLESIYFGGGTPSLVDAEHIVSTLDELAKAGFIFDQSTEITVEINPATVRENKLEKYLERGVNRFSVGAQTFDDALLKRLGREHNSQDTIATLELLAKYSVNYSFDLLFALPGQTLSMLERDLKTVQQFKPGHLSAYCLTIPSSHSLSPGRPPDEEQEEMFWLIEDQLLDIGLERYEISNFAIKGRESRHNLLYWQDQAYWGIGLSSHSYSKNTLWGERYWNPNAIGAYENWVDTIDANKGHSNLAMRDNNHFEILAENQALTDFCHTSLRLKEGLSYQALCDKFSPGTAEKVSQRAKFLLETGLLTINSSTNWALTRKGIIFSNRVFEDFTFLTEDLAD